MYAARVIGRVVATRKAPQLKGIKLLLLQPTSWHGLPDGEPLVAADSVGAGYREWVFFVRSREAAVAFDTLPPVDASVLGIIDGIDLLEGY